MFLQKNNLGQIKDFTCPKCGSKRFVLSGSRLDCTNCDYSFKGIRPNKYGAVRTESKDGKVRDSKFESGVADDLLLRKKVGDIKDYESQYKVEMWAYRADGQPAFKVSHKVDFRVHNNDESFTLLEAKGYETDDYKWRRRFLEKLWLPLHPDHTYEVVKQGRMK